MTRPRTYRVFTLRPSGRPSFSTTDRREAFRLAYNAAAITGCRAVIYLRRQGRRLRIVSRIDPADAA